MCERRRSGPRASGQRCSALSSGSCPRCGTNETWRPASMHAQYMVWASQSTQYSLRSWANSVAQYYASGAHCAARDLFWRQVRTCAHIFARHFKNSKTVTYFFSTLSTYNAAWAWACSRFSNLLQYNSLITGHCRHWRYADCSGKRPGKAESFLWPKDLQSRLGIAISPQRSYF